jgi:hypothetical protein
VKILVAIANYGPYRFGYLDKVLKTFQRMRDEVDVVIHSDRPKVVPPGVRLVVGLPTSDPYSLPFAHKQLFAEQQDRYDLFVYTEDDILIEEHNLAAFLDATRVLPEDEITGFFRFEHDDEGRIFFVDAHAHYDWIPNSVQWYGGYTFAAFSNEHSGCYVLTQAQLKAAVRSGGYLVPPHATWYEMRESAATDPYTQCGLTKRLCLSHFDAFLVHHLPNTYVGRVGMEEARFRGELARLLNAIS